jgi:hypothetical protein
MTTEYFIAAPLEMKPGITRAELQKIWEEREMDLHSARSMLEKSGAGVEFPAGASAIYCPATSLLVVKNTPANLAAVRSLFDGGCDMPPHNIRVEARIVEVPVEVAPQLESHRDFAELERKFGDRLRLVCATSLVIRNGNRAIVVTGAPVRAGKPENPAVDAPPVEGITLDVDAFTGADGASIDLRYDFSYVAPGAPKANDFRCKTEGNIHVAKPGLKMLPMVSEHPQGEVGARKRVLLLGAHILDEAGQPRPFKQEGDER